MTGKDNATEPIYDVLGAQWKMSMIFLQCGNQSQKAFHEHDSAFERIVSLVESDLTNGKVYYKGSIGIVSLDLGVINVLF